MGLRSKTVARNTLANANEKRDWRIFADLAQILIQRATNLYCDEPISPDLDLDATAYALDSSTIDLCLALFPWAPFRRAKAAVKMHTLLDLRGSIPQFISITDGKVHDVNILDELTPMPGAYYIMDRAYVDFQRLFILNQAKAFFVTRTKKNLKFTRRYSRRKDRDAGIICDQTIMLSGPLSKLKYPEPLRRVHFHDVERDKRLIFLTNNFSLDAVTIAHLYKARWKIELFFKWIKQHLRIKRFLGTSENAVKTQIWIALSVYLLVAIMRKELDLEPSLYTILQVLSLNMFSQVPIPQLFTKPPNTIYQGPSCTQLSLFDL